MNLLRSFAAQNYYTGTCLKYDTKKNPPLLTLDTCVKTKDYTQNFMHDGDTIVLVAEKGGTLVPSAIANDLCLKGIPVPAGSAATLVACDETTDTILETDASLLLVPAQTDTCPEDDPCGLL